jgi:hypothetical protein
MADGTRITDTTLVSSVAEFVGNRYVGSVLSGPVRIKKEHVAALLGISLGDGLIFSTWAELEAVAGDHAGQPGVVVGDAGTHTDPVTSATVDNEGKYSWSKSPAGWERVGDYDTVSQEDLDEEIAARTAADAAERAQTVEDVIASVVDQEQAMRPGDTSGGFVSSIAGGEPRDLSSTLDGSATVDESGRVIRITGAGIIARRTLFALEADRKYLVRYAVQRRVNTTDPANDSVRCAVAWFDQTKTAIGGTPTTTAQNFTALDTGDGRVTLEVVVARSSGSGVDIAAPSGTRYFRPYVQTYGTTPQTDIELIDVVDITNATTYSPDISAAEARITALENEDLPDRVDALESAVTAPDSLRFATEASAIAATIGASVDVIETLGYSAAGDGNSTIRVRGADGPDALESADGAFWPLARGPLVTVKAGNGVDSDHERIQDKIDAVEAWGGGTVMLLNGTHFLEKAGDAVDGHINIKSGVRLVGESFAAILKVSSSAGLRPAIGNVVGAPPADAEISGFTIEGKGWASPGDVRETGIWLADGPTNCLIDRMIIHSNPYDGILIEGGASDAADKNRVMRCHVYNNGDDGINVGGDGNDVLRTIIHNNHVHDCNAGIHVSDGASETTVAHNHVWDCVEVGINKVLAGAKLIVDSNFVSGCPYNIYIWGSDTAAVKNNVSIDASTAHIWIAQTVVNPTIKGNECYGGAAKGIYVQASGGYADVCDNLLKDIGTNAIEAALTSATMRVANNRIINAGGKGIYLGHSAAADKFHLIHNNVIETCGDNGIQTFNASKVEIIGNKVTGTGGTYSIYESGTAGNSNILFNRVDKAINAPESTRVAGHTNVDSAPFLLTNADDMNDLTADGIYIIGASAPSNAPNSTYAVVHCIFQGQARGIQIVYDLDRQDIWFRSYVSSTWGPWTSATIIQSTTAAGIASAADSINASSYKRQGRMAIDHSTGVLYVAANGAATDAWHTYARTSTVTPS